VLEAGAARLHADGVDTGIGTAPAGDVLERADRVHLSIVERRRAKGPRTVELHRTQVMSRLNANTLAELLQLAPVAGIAPLSSDPNDERRGV
jgi:hypothetical protein